MQNFKPVELEDVYRLFNLGATSLVSAADGDDVDVMPATWVCPLNTTPALSTAVIDSVHYTRKLIDKTGYFMLSLPSLAIARETLYLGSVSKFDEADKIEKSGAKLFKFEGCDIPTVEGVLCAVLFKVIPNEYNEKKHDLFIGEAVAAWADSRVFSGAAMVSPSNADCVRRDIPSRKDGKMQCWLQRNRVGTTDHILRQCLLRRSCCIRPLQRLHTVHKPPNQRALCIRLQHRKEKQQGRGRGGISPALQVTVCAAGNTKLLRHGLLSQCLLLPQRRQFFGKKLCEQRRVWFHSEDLHSL